MIRDMFLGQDWRTHIDDPFAFLGRFPPGQPEIRMSRDSLCLLSATALHYFLPIFLSAIMTDPEEADVMVTSIASIFNNDSLLTLMTTDQRKATAAVLKTVTHDLHSEGLIRGEFEELITVLESPERPDG